jgi:hypothetical protein
MKTSRPLTFRWLAVVVCFAISGSVALYRAQSVPDLVEATEIFLASLSPEQAAQVRFDFDDEERFNWHFIPRERNGLPFREMEPHQQALAHSMMSSVLGYRGVMKASTIMSLEQVLSEIEGPNGRFNRDPEMYFFSIFGQPSRDGTWAWRLEGHHLAVNVTMSGGEILASTPAFMGSNPAEVREGPRQGLRALGAEEDRGRELFTALDDSQQEQALLEGRVPGDIITSNQREASLDGMEGIPASALNARQTGMLRAVIGEYTNRMPPEVAARVMADMEDAGFDDVRFAWSGTSEVGAPHYYRVQGPTFLIEYDNTQNQANHVHSVFRDLRHDWGQDTLRAHYEAYHNLAAAD